GFHAVVWTEPDEPQAAIGSHLHSIAYPANYEKHVDAGALLTEAYEHSGHDIQDIVLRGVYLYTANGPGGFEVFDVANIDQKGFSERIVSAPVSPLGQRTRIHTKYATSVALPSTLALDPGRQHIPENEEQPIDLFYAFVYISDREEGLVISNVATLVDGNPDNNFLKENETVRFNPGGVLTGATFVAAAGHRLYMTTPRGLHVIDVENPERPFIDQMFNAGGALNDTRAVQIGSVNASQFALVADGKNGLRVVQLVSPDTVPGAQGFSPRPSPKLIATYPTKGEAICVSRGLERDRVVDETGGETVVFGRRGARPFHLNEMEHFYRTSTSGEGKNVAGRG